MIAFLLFYITMGVMTVFALSCEEGIGPNLLIFFLWPMALGFFLNDISWQCDHSYEMLTEQKYKPKDKTEDLP